MVDGGGGGCGDGGWQLAGGGVCVWLIVGGYFGCESEKALGYFGLNKKINKNGMVTPSTK